jgi:hypothetical protein
MSYTVDYDFEPVVTFCQCGRANVKDGNCPEWEEWGDCEVIERGIFTWIGDGVTYNPNKWQRWNGDR